MERGDLLGVKSGCDVKWNVPEGVRTGCGALGVHLFHSSSRLGREGERVSGDVDGGVGALLGLGVVDTDLLFVPERGVPGVLARGDRLLFSP